MRNRVKYNEIVVTPTLLFRNLRAHEQGSGRQLSPDEIGDDLYRLCSNSYFLGEDGRIKWCRESIEAFARHMVASCATKVHMPTLSGHDVPSIVKLKMAVTESLRKRISFTDRTNAIWAAILKYLDPIIRSIGPREYRIGPCGNDVWDMLDRIAWNLYLLALASRRRTEVVVNLSDQTKAIYELLRKKSMGPEAQARLSNVEGLFRVYDRQYEVPGFRIMASNQGAAVSDRIEEILEDAYLLEASRLRRFLGLKANIASIRRDLRSLTKYIAKNRKWAKGVLAAVSETGYTPPNDAMEKFLNALPEGNWSTWSPICIDAVSHLSNMRVKQNDFVFQVRRNLIGTHTYSSNA